jgi:hypothetical protein
MFSTEHFKDIKRDVPLEIAISVFVIAVIIMLLLNLFVAQLNGFTRPSMITWWAMHG